MTEKIVCWAPYLTNNKSYDTNLFFSKCNIPVPFATVNSELSKINQWFLANKLSFNVTQAKYSFFHKTNKKKPYIAKTNKASNEKL